MQNAMVREYRRRCNTVENIHKVTGSRGGSRGRVQGVCTPPPEMTCGFLIQLVFCKKRKAIWFIGVEEEQETRLKNLC